MGKGGLDLESEPGHIHPFLLPIPSFSQTPELTGLAGWHLREEGET